MIRILQISDIHCGPHFRPEVADALLSQVPRLFADVIVLAGDFTQRAKRQEFADARKFLDRLPELPTVVIPGNHDVPLYRVWERILSPHRNYCEAISPKLNNVVTCEAAVIVGLDSTAPRTAIVNGWIGAEQIEFCRAAFAQADRAMLKVVVAHHPVISAPDYERGVPMRYATRFVRACEEMGVDLILGGHLHRAYVGTSLDVFPHRERKWRTLIVQSGTAASGRGRTSERQRNSINLIELERRSCRVATLHYDRKRGEFVPVAHQERRELPTGATLGERESPGREFGAANRNDEQH